MYDKFDQVPGLIKKAEEYVILHDRALYRPILACIEEYCAANETIIGNLCYIFKANEREDYFIDVYAAYALTVAREISDAMYKLQIRHVPIETTSVRTVIKNGEFEVRVFDRLVCRVFSMQKHHQLDFIHLLGPIERPGIYSSATLKVMPPEIQLIGVYHDLYNIANVKKWQKLLDLADDLWNGLDIVAASRKTITGGARNKKKKSHSNKEILAALGAPIVVGDLALKHYGYEKSGGRIQILSDELPEDIVKKLSKVLGKCNAIKYPLHLPLDFQATKYTIYAGEETRVPICDVYNSLTYEIIPYSVHGNAKIASEFVVLRFLLINLWSQRAIMKLGRYNEDMIVNYVNAAQHMRQIIAGKKVEKLFLGWKYAGVNKNPAVVKNRMRAEAGKFPNYYPAIFAKRKSIEEDAASSAQTENTTPSAQTELDKPPTN